MEGRIDSSFTTEQRDLFASGIVAEIGVSAYAVWHAIKYYADYNTGKAFPGMRTIAAKLGISVGSVSNAIKSLEAARMLRVVQGHTKRRGQTYIACERLDVRLGDRVLCTVVLDYIPATMRHSVNTLNQALSSGSPTDEAFAKCQILPGPGFVWNPQTGRLVGEIAASEIPQHLPDLTEEQLKAPLVQKVLAIQNRAKKKHA